MVDFETWHTCASIVWHTVRFKICNCHLQGFFKHWRKFRISSIKEQLSHNPETKPDSLHPLPSAKEEWSDETSDQPKTVESCGRDSPIQDGGNPYPSGFAPPGGLDGESGSDTSPFPSTRTTRNTWGLGWMGPTSLPAYHLACFVPLEHLPSWWSH